ncbi:MAG: hypothetical protein KA114_06590 [Bacteroidales bacterium]|nr:hypothetical protein [Bacteroidales bacterium]
MKKPLIIVIIILGLILILPAINFFRWAFQEKKPINIIILDKTVPTLERINHKSLVWVLTNGRFVKSNGNSYSFRKDYYGFFPTRPLREKGWKQNNLRITEIMSIADSMDALYYTDTYGVFTNDWYRGISKSRRSRKLYGGLNNTDYLYLVEMQLRNKLCILEYNTFDYPTADLERYKTKERLGIEFDGWTGKYFSSLDTAARENKDFPIWMTAMYRRQYFKPWTFTKPGIVLLNNQNIIVLEEGKQLKNSVPVIITDSVYSKKYGVAQRVGFEGWFDIIHPKENIIISKYKIETTSEGDSILADYNLLNEFPAVITDPNNQRTYYFCGDFTANKINFWTSRLNGLPGKKGIYYSNKENDPRRFFWLYYKPLVKGIFTNYYNEIKNPGN